MSKDTRVEMCDENVFAIYYNNHIITFNCKKTVCMKFDSETNDYEHMTLKDTVIDWV